MEESKSMLEKLDVKSFIDSNMHARIHEHIQANIHAYIHTLMHIHTELFVNNISGYAKFPTTCFFRYLPKKLAIFYQNFFSGDRFLSTIQKISHFQAEF